MTLPHLTNLTLLAIKAALEAGDMVLKIYNSEYNTTYKEDDSPLTTADISSHNCIAGLLADTAYPLLSEEGKNIPWDIRRSWKYYWLIDPLDGTKEFISRNGEFTVNIAFIADHKPVIGVIYIPVSGMLYVGNPETGSWSIDCNKLKIDPEETLSAILGRGTKLPEKENTDQLTILASRSHLNQETAKIIDRIQQEFDGCKLINAGSSLKFCRLAEGSAQYYPRFSPTMEWDTAAGHAIAAFAGIAVKAWPGMQPLAYNTKESLVNPWFMAHKEGLPDFAE